MHFEDCRIEFEFWLGGLLLLLLGSIGSRLLLLRFRMVLHSVMHHFGLFPLHYLNLFLSSGTFGRPLVHYFHIVCMIPWSLLSNTSFLISIIVTLLSAALDQSWAAMASRRPATILPCLFVSSHQRNSHSLSVIVKTVISISILANTIATWAYKWSWWWASGSSWSLFGVTLVVGGIMIRWASVFIFRVFSVRLLLLVSFWGITFLLLTTFLLVCKLFCKSLHILFLFSLLAGFLPFNPLFPFPFLFCPFLGVLLGLMLTQNVYHFCELLGIFRYVILVFAEASETLGKIRALFVILKTRSICITSTLRRLSVENRNTKLLKKFLLFPKGMQRINIVPTEEFRSLLFVYGTILFCFL